MVALVAFSALAGSMLMMTYAADLTSTEDTSTTNLMASSNSTDLPFGNCPMMGFGGGGRGHGPGQGTMAQIEVSEEYTQKVKDIASNDTDVQNLLAEGYNMTTVRPIIKTVIDADGNVVTKATSAVLTLEKDTTGYATVHVDLEQAKVTKIAIITRTVIDKSTT